MSVRCKMRVTEVISRTSAGYNDAPPIDSQSVKLTAVTDDANKTWSKWTPSGSVELCINNPSAFEQFKIGDYMFVDFTPAPAKEADEKA